MNLPVINIKEATFECIFGRGCDGICCQNGRPSLYPEEDKQIKKHLQKFLPHLRPRARALVEKQSYKSNRRKFGMPMLRVIDGWCIFFNEGCVLHKVGALEGDKYAYKPAQCALFPLAKTDDDRWYIRQWGFLNEPWDIFCLNPQATKKRAAQSLQEEMRLAAKYDEESGK